MCVTCHHLYRGLLTPTVARPLSGLADRPQLIVHGVLSAIKEVYNNKADVYLNELCWWLAIHHNVAISKSALQQNLMDAGLTRKLLHKIARERDEEARRGDMGVICDH